MRTQRGFSLLEVILAFALLSVSLGGAGFCVLLALPISFLVVRYKGRLAIWAERLPYLLHALPGLVIALTLVFFALHYVPALYQTSGLLLIAYALLFLPLALPSRYEWTLLGAILAAALLMGALPAWRAYRQSLADGLSIRL